MGAERECVSLANKLIVECQLAHPRVAKLSHVKPQLVALLFKACCGIEVQGSIENPSSLEDEACNVQEMLDVLSRDVLFMSLAHVTGRDIVSRNADALLDLLEILEGCWTVRSAPPSSSSSSSPSWIPGSMSGTSSTSEHGVRRFPDPTSRLQFNLRLDCVQNPKCNPEPSRPSGPGYGSNPEPVWKPAKKPKLIRADMYTDRLRVRLCTHEDCQVR
ncbi:hypothetical protein IscW_ISCW011184 [Ixodes scapularis]|uniref:DUF5745 domain-containing protein n=1 Tax=Ixodes scapularis TaxID=6945 RepID=B7Q5U6_IXOSC|nr:hypothetical protein IscW_ISCW011184 [Ixodes scapularis]|eukprot:XP_002411818.1 hypothetical protein IscW_ISCW011184 [Ixodes scapularis]